MTSDILGVALPLLLLVASSAAASRSPASSEPVGILEDPCSVLAPIPPEVTRFRAEVAAAKAAGRPMPSFTSSYMEIHAQWVQRRLLQDFSGLCTYRDENARLAPNDAERIVFFGDSITQLWSAADPEFFTAGRVNRGISGQTTAQMLGRFRHDVVALRPRAVHIMAGTNDLAGNTGPTTLAWIQSNIRSMVDLARANRIAVILAAVPPAARFNWRPAIRPVPQIEALNAWLREYAASERLVFVDYGSVLGDGAGGIKRELSTDGVHPNPAAYALMRKVAQGAIGEATRGY